jgi:hypothetical protein
LKKEGCKKERVTIMGLYDIGKSQTPQDLVVKFQRIDIVAVMLWLVSRLRVVYKHELKG